MNVSVLFVTSASGEESFRNGKYGAKAMKKSSCKTCGSPWHTGMWHKPRKPIPKVGKQGKKTAAAVAKWKKTQKPTHEGYFICYMCGKWVPYLTAEHVKSKTHRPDLRTDPSNFKPTCDPCNDKKRSKDS